MWLDRVIYELSPQWSLKRERARLGVNLLKRGYDGADKGRRLSGWVTAGASVNAEIAIGANKLRERARDLVRNNPYAEKALLALTHNSIGYGISPQAGVTDKSGAPNKEQNDKIMAAFRAWVRVCDFEENLDFFGLQALAARTIFEGGDVFVRFFYDKTKTLKIQILESDFLDTSKSGVVAGGGVIDQGIEFNSIGQKVAYWLFSEHPGGGNVKNRNSSRVPASEILHVFEKKRPGQIRGVTRFAPVIVRMYDLDGYDEAELVRKKIEACFSAFVTQPNGSDGPTLAPVSTAASGLNPRIEDFSPGMVSYLNPGEDVKFGTPTSDSNYEPYQRVQLRAIAAGLGITYELLTGDLSGVNYSSMRGGTLEFRRMIEAFRWQVFIPSFCQKIWERFIDWAYMTNQIDVQDYNTTWSPPKFEMIDPKTDAESDELMIRNGTKTWRQAVSEQGFDPDIQLQEIADTMKKFDELGVILDCDPRKDPKQQITQQVQDNNNGK